LTRAIALNLRRASTKAADERFWTACRLFHNLYMRQLQLFRLFGFGVPVLLSTWRTACS